LNIFENSIGKFKVNVTDEMIHEKIADFIVSNCQAYNVVEDEAFKALTKLAFPNYKLPGREFFKSFIAEIYVELVKI
jgi:hypothetical protein